MLMIRVFQFCCTQRVSEIKQTSLHMKHAVVNLRGRRVPMFKIGFSSALFSAIPDSDISTLAKHIQCTKSNKKHKESD